MKSASADLINKKDRRGFSRYILVQSASAHCSSWNGNGPIEACVHDVSSSGFLIEITEPIPVGSNISVFLPLQIVDKPLQIIGRVVWIKKSNESMIHGIEIVDTLINKSIYASFIEALGNIKKPKDRRISQEDKHEYPLKNRGSDYKILSHDSPYVSFFKTLELECNNGTIDTIIISDSLSYLKKRVRKMAGDSPQILLASELKSNLHGNTIVILNLECRRKHEPFVFLDFDEYLLKTQGLGEPLVTLNKVSVMSQGGGAVTFISLGEIQNNSLATKYFYITRFERINFVNKRKVNATKRYLLNQKINGGSFVLKEVENKNEIKRLQDFSVRFYSAGYNFNNDIDSLFMQYSHFYEVINVETSEIITCARVTFHLPGFYLPCMLATKEGSEDHIQLQNPDNISYGEIYAPYFSSISALKAYGELVRRFIYYTNEKFVDVFLTTHNVEKSAESRFLSKYLGFKETNVVLKYGDFGGLWNLIYLTQPNLDKNIQIHFSSLEQSPQFVNTFRKH